MKKYRSPLHIFGFSLIIFSIIAFLVSMVLCYIGQDKGIISLFVSLLVFFIGYKAYTRGKKQTENHFGNDNKNKDEDENIYKDTLKKD